MKLLKFGAPWCISCSILTKMMDTIDIDIPVEYVDIDIDLATGAKYQIRTLPTLVLLDDQGVEIKRMNSPKSAAALKSWLVN